MVQLRLHSRPSVPTTSSAYPSTNGFTPASALCNIAAAARRAVTMLLALASSRRMESAGGAQRGQESVKWHREQ